MTCETSLNQSVHGLKPDCLPFREVLAQSFAVIAPTTTPAANLALIFAMSGNGTWLSFLLGMMGLVFICININQFARRSASPGSLYSYIAKGLSPTAGVLCGWSLVLGYLFTGMATLCGFAIFGETLLGHVGIHTSPLTLLALGIGIAGYMAYQDIQLSATTMLILEGISAALILILVLIVWTQTGFALDGSQLSLQNATPSGVTMGLVLVVFGFSGFESATSLGDEAKNPLRTIPKAVISSTLLTGLFFIFTAYIEVLGFNHQGLSLADVEEPLSVLASHAGVGFLGDAIAISALLSFFACVLGSINPAARIFFMMARHGVFHTSLGETHSENQTPHVAVLISAVIMFLIPASMSLFNLPLFQSMGYLGTICTYGFLLTYILISVAAPVYLYRIRQLRFRDGVCAVLGVVFMMLPLIGTTGIPGSDLFPVPEYPYNVFPTLFLLYLLVGCGWFIVQGLRSPQKVQNMEQHIEAIHTRFSPDAVVVEPVLTKKTQRRPR